MDYTQILLKPVVTEKSTSVQEEQNQVVFYVAQKANKIEVKKAVEAAFKVKVEDVNIVVRKPRVKTRQGRAVGQSAGWKKAYVTLAENSKIEFYEGV